MLDNSEGSTLHSNLEQAKAILHSAQEEAKRIRKLLSKAEDGIVEASEGLRKATEDLETFTNTKVVNVVDEDLRDIDLERLRSDLPRLMKLIENEKPLLRDLEVEEPEEDEGSDEFDD